MHKLLATFLILLTGWTLSAHWVVLSGQSLQKLIVIAPFIIGCLGLIYLYLSLKIPLEVPSKTLKTNNLAYRNAINPPIALLFGLCLTPMILYLSWMAFWIFCLFILTYCIVQPVVFNPIALNKTLNLQGWEWAVVLCFSLAAVVLTLAVSRSDLDDAFYVAVAAFSSINPTQPLLAFDPMHGDNNLPLLFPSYRFASFELLAGAIAHLLGMPAMDIIYKLLPPLWAITSVFCIFLLAQTLMPKRWLMLGAIILLLTILLGESHRAPANMMFVRLFQGKALYLSIIVPTIFYLTARYCSKQGRPAELFLLGCCQLTAIGLSNFGMLAAPIAAVGALLSNIPSLETAMRKKLCGVFGTLLIPVPYLTTVAINSCWGSSVIQFQSETASQVWISVFGARQQYLLAILLLIGPVLARDTVMRWRLAVPPLLLFGIFLNPWIANFISKNITTPPVYWRVVWSFPILPFAAVSICTVIERLLERKERGWFSTILLVIVIGLCVFSWPLNTLRRENIGVIQDFAGRKVPINDYIVAKKAMQITESPYRLLAPDEISGVISRFEIHPKLVSVRGHYLDALAPAFSREEYYHRYILRSLVSGTLKNNQEIIRAALISLKVSTIAMPQLNENDAISELLKAENYQLIEVICGYSIWNKAVF